MSCSIEVIGAGMGRTGTKSLQAALDLLGYKTYHFPLPEHARTWSRFAEGQVSSEEVIDMVAQDGFTATCDNPAADLYAEQLKKNPNAKVILTVRDSSEKWVASWKVLMKFVEIQERQFSILYPTFIQWIPFMRDWKRMRDYIGTHLGLPPGQLIRGWSKQPDPDRWLAEQYDAHNAQVMSRVPSNQLLIFNVKEGWAPLCKFLSKDVPTDSFPNVNESGDLRMAQRVMVVASYAWIPTAAVAVHCAHRFWKWRFR